MATAKKNAKGNKTAHVLNLLTAPGEAAAAPAESDADAPVQEAPQPAASGRPLLPPILEVAQSNDDNLAQQIQQALEDELSAAEPPAPQPAPAAPAPSGGKMSQDDIEQMMASMATAQEAPAPQPAPAAPAPSGGKMSQDDIERMMASMATAQEAPAPQPAPEAPAPSGGKMSQDDIERMMASMAAAQEAPAPQPAPAAPAPQPEPPAPKQAAPEEEDIIYVNVMQTLVEEKAPGYMKKFGLCTCKHCQADVKALTLSNLVPKYVVLSKLDRIPMLTVYEGRYNSTIFAQLTRACKVVMDHPHHNRES